jgi:chromosome segregation ATPase
MTEQDITIGEIGRAVARMEQAFAESRESHHRQIQATNHALGELSKKMDTYIGPVAVLEKQAASAEQAIERLDGEMKAVSAQAARVSAAGSLLAFIAALIPWSWKH